MGLKLTPAVNANSAEAGTPFTSSSLLYPDSRTRPHDSSLIKRLSSDHQASSLLLLHLEQLFVLPICSVSDLSNQEHKCAPATRSAPSSTPGTPERDIRALFWKRTQIQALRCKTCCEREGLRGLEARTRRQMLPSAPITSLRSKRQARFLRRASSRPPSSNSQQTANDPLTAGRTGTAGGAESGTGMVALD